MTDLDLVLTVGMLGTLKSSKFLNGSLLLLLLLPPVLRTCGSLWVPLSFPATDATAFLPILLLALHISEVNPVALCKWRHFIYSENKMKTIKLHLKWLC